MLELLKGYDLEGPIAYPDHMEGQIHKWADCINIQCELWLCHGLELIEGGYYMSENVE